MKKKKIVFILPMLNGGGAERVAVNYMRQLNLSKYELFVIVFQESNEISALLPESCNLVNLNTKSTKNSFFELIKTLREIMPNIVYTTHSRVATLLMLVKPFVRKFYHIARMQNTPTLEKKYNNYGIIHRILYALGFKSADIVIAQTEEMKYDAIKVFKLDEQSIKVMNNPLDKVYIKQSIIDSINPFQKDKISAVVSGRLKKEKGFDLVLKSMKVILTNYPNFVLHILGYNEGERDNLIQLSENLNIQNNVIFHDYISNPYSYYVNCDLFILSSYKEGFPNVMLENYYLNTPIVATKCVPIVEQLIVNNQNGYVCEVGDLECLTQSILNCIKNISRSTISNKEYLGSNLEDLIREI